MYQHKINNSYLIGVITTLIGVFLMSTESLLIKLSIISGTTYSFYIGILMFISLNAILLKGGFQKSLNIYKEGMKVILIAGILIGLANIFFIHAIKHTSIANSVIIKSSAPLFTTLFAYLFYKQKPHKNVFVASVFIFIGLIIIFSNQLSGGNLYGDILALFCTISFSLTFVLMARFKNVNRLAVIAFGGICITFMSSFFMEDVSDFQVDVTSLYVLIIAGLIVSPFARMFILNGTKNIPASEVSLLSIFETILAPVWAWVFLQELPHVNTLIGGIIIIATLVLNSLYIINQKRG